MYLCIRVVKAIQAILQLHGGFVFIFVLLRLRGRRGTRRRGGFCLRGRIVAHVLKLSEVIVIKVCEVLAIVEVVVVASPGDGEGKEDQQSGNREEVRTAHGGTCTEVEEQSERELVQQTGTHVNKGGGRRDREVTEKFNMANTTQEEGKSYSNFKNKKLIVTLV